MNFYPHHIGDYVSATAHLSMLEDGAYRRLLDAYYSRETVLPADVAACCRLVRAVSKDERKAVEVVLREFFHLTPTGWSHRRCDAEIAKASSKRTKAAESAAKRWSSERNANAYANAPPNAMPTHSEGNAPNPNPSKENTDIARASAVDLAVAFRQAGVQANGANPEVMALAEQGVSAETVTAACEEARKRKPGERIPVGYVARVLETWAKRAADTRANGAHAPPPEPHPARPPTKAETFVAKLNGSTPQETVDVIATAAPSARRLGA